MNRANETLASPKVLSTGVEIPEDGVPVNDGGHQFTTRTEKRPETIDAEEGASGHGKTGDDRDGNAKEQDEYIARIETVGA